MSLETRDQQGRKNKPIFDKPNSTLRFMDKAKALVNERELASRKYKVLNGVVGKVRS